MKLKTIMDYEEEYNPEEVEFVDVAEIPTVPSDKIISQNKAEFNEYKRKYPDLSEEDIEEMFIDDIGYEIENFNLFEKLNYSLKKYYREMIKQIHYFKIDHCEGDDTYRVLILNKKKEYIYTVTAGLHFASEAEYIIKGIQEGDQKIMDEYLGRILKYKESNSYKFITND